MLVIFKSAPILKKVLRIKQAMLQYYALKLIKMQTRHLGRQWRKTNMGVMSAIYQKVRHRLGDDWAFGNEQEAQGWDFQSDECALRTRIDKFNQRRYRHIDEPLNPDFLPNESSLFTSLRSGSTFSLILSQSIISSNHVIFNLRWWFHWRFDYQWRRNAGEFRYELWVVAQRRGLLQQDQLGFTARSQLELLYSFLILLLFYHRLSHFMI